MNENPDQHTPKKLLELTKNIDEVYNAAKSLHSKQIEESLKTIEDELCELLKAKPEELAKRTSRMCLSFVCIY